MAPGAPAPPSMLGNGNQSRSGSGCWFGVSEAMTPGSQAPMSCMGALWLAPSPAELPAPCWADVVRKPLLNGLVAAKLCTSWAAFSQQGSSKDSDLAVPVTLAELHSRSAKK